MRLYTSPTSPFAAKVRAVAVETGLEASIDYVEVNPWEAPQALLAQNPIGQVPTLVTAEGEALFDSAVICEYLDSLHPGQPLLAPEGAARWTTLRLQALADGIMESALLRRLESLRPVEQRSADRDDGLAGQVARALRALEVQAEAWGKRVDLGLIATACALAYLDFRFEGEPWREEHPELAAWYAGFGERPSLRAARPGA